MSRQTRKVTWTRRAGTEGEGGEIGAGGENTDELDKESDGETQSEHRRNSRALMLKATASAPKSLEALQKAVMSEVTLKLTTLWTPSPVSFCVTVSRTWHKDTQFKAKRRYILWSLSPKRRQSRLDRQMFKPILLVILHRNRTLLCQQRDAKNEKSFIWSVGDALTPG